MNVALADSYIADALETDTPLSYGRVYMIGPR